MTPAQMLRVHCTALGFLAVVLKDVEQDKQALRAKTIGRLIESFCMVTVPDALNASNENIGDESDLASIDAAIEKYKAELIDQGSAQLPDDRETLLKFYDRLTQRQQRWRERHFYATGSDEMIATRILQLIEEEISGEESAT
jgi:hypothetical protein